MIRIALVLILCATALPAVVAEKPNVVFVLFDDLGYSTPGAKQPGEPGVKRAVPEAAPGSRDRGGSTLPAP
jgi:hypothetical protein